MIINQEYAEYLSCGSEILGFGGGGNAQEGLAWRKPPLRGLNKKDIL